MGNKIVCALCIVPFVVSVLCGQHRKLQFDQLGVEQGLSEGIVLSVLQDREGFMWFATADGLNRYDGYNFTVFRNSAKNPLSISSNYVHTIYEDRAGHMWIGSLGGLDFFDRKKEQFFHYPLDPLDSAGAKKYPIVPILEDKEGALWIGTLGGGVVKLVFAETGEVPPRVVSREQFKHEPDVATSLSDNQISSLFEDRESNLWIGTWEGGLNKFDRRSRTFTRHRHSRTDLNSLSHDFIRIVFVDSYDNLWIGTEGGGLDRMVLGKTTSSRSFIHYRHDEGNPKSIGYNVVRSIHQDRYGSLWIGTDGGGLDLYNRAEDSFAHYKHDPGVPTSIASNRIICIFEDNVGTLWFGTWGNGVSRYAPTRLKFRNSGKFEAMLDRLSSKFILSLHEDKDTNLWIGTHGGGLNKYNPRTNSVKHFRHEIGNPTSLINDVVWCITGDNKDALWLATDQGVERFDLHRETFTHYQHDPKNPNSLSGNFVNRVHADQNGLIWILARDALNKLDPSTRTFTRFPMLTPSGDSLSGSGISALFEDRAGMIWLGVGGLAKFDRATARATIYVPAPEDSETMVNATVSSILQDSRGFVWISTYGDGFHMLDTTTRRFKHFDEDDGLANNVVYGMLEDRHGNLWLSTNKGLSNFDPRTQRFRNYDVRDGLQSNEFNRGAFFKTADGRMLFGGIRGINEFFPDSIRDNEHKPSIVFTAFKKSDELVHFDSSLTTVREITLNHSENFFSFEFASLDFTEPTKNRYMYQLSGLEREWVDAGTRRYARYTNVDPGEYVFRVRGSNNDGVWNEEGLAIRVFVTPPFWATWWFVTASVIVIAGMFGGIVWYASVRRLKRQLEELERERAIQQERERISRDLHDHVGAQLVNIISGLDLVGKYSPPTESRVQHLLRSLQQDARASILQLRETIWAIKTKSMTLEKFSEQVEQYSRRQMEFYEEVELSFESKCDPSIQLTPVQVLSCFRIIQEALTNVLKHAHAQNIRIEIRTAESNLYISVIDDGVGMRAGAADDLHGNGIPNMKRRAEELSGRCEFGSAGGNGTKVTIVIPLCNAQPS